MKILVVSRGVKPIGVSLAGGAELVMLRLAEQAVEAGHEVHMVTDVVPGFEVDPRLTVHPVGVPNRLSGWLRGSGFVFWVLLHFLGNLLVTWRALRVTGSDADGFDVIHCHGNLSGLLISYRRGKSALVYTEHDSTPWYCKYPGRAQPIIRKAIYTALDARLFRRADLNLVLYAGQKDEIIDRWSIDRSSVEVVPNGVDTNQFNPTPVSDSEMQPDAGYCLFVGRLEARKGVDTLISALPDCEVDCVIVGDGPDRNRLVKLADELGVSDRVRFTGPVANTRLAAYYAKAGVYVLPSHSEAFPLSLLESMACGTPFLATSVGANADVVKATSAGELFDPGDAKGLAQRLRDVMLNTARADEMGRRGRIAAEEVFSWPKIGTVLTATYEDLVNGVSDVVPVERDQVATNSLNGTVPYSNSQLAPENNSLSETAAPFDAEPNSGR